MQQLAPRASSAMEANGTGTAGASPSALPLWSQPPPKYRELLVAAARLHDVGYAEPAKDTGFRPIDGGRYLRPENRDSLLPRWSVTTPGPDSLPMSADWTQKRGPSISNRHQSRSQ